MTTYDGDLLEDVALEGRGRARDGKNVSVLVTSGARRTSGVMPPRLTKDERRRRERERRLPPCSEQVGRRARNCRHPPGQPAVQTVAGEGDSIQRPNPERIEAHTGAGRVGGRVQDREGSGRARRRRRVPSVGLRVCLDHVEDRGRLQLGQPAELSAARTLEGAGPRARDLGDPTNARRPPLTWLARHSSVRRARARSRPLARPRCFLRRLWPSSAELPPPLGVLSLFLADETKEAAASVRGGH